MEVMETDRNLIVVVVRSLDMLIHVLDVAEAITAVDEVFLDYFGKPTPQFWAGLPCYFIVSRLSTNSGSDALQGTINCFWFLSDFSCQMGRGSSPS